MAEAAKIYTVNQPEKRSNNKVEARFPSDTAKDKLFYAQIEVDEAVPFSIEIKPLTELIRILPDGFDLVFGIDEYPQAPIEIVIDTADTLITLDQMQIGNYASGCFWEVRLLETTAKKLNILPLGTGTLIIEYA